MQSEAPFTSALRDIMSLLDSGYKGMIIGGIAVIALGYPRVTTDVDVTVLVRGFSDLLERPEMYKLLEDVIRRVGQ